MAPEGPGRAPDATYVRVHPYLINIDRNPVRLLKLLYRKSAPLGIIDWNTPPIAARFRTSALYIMISIGLKCVAARAIRRVGGRPSFVLLPDHGDVAMFCFPECVRLFDLESARITNLCAPGSPDRRSRLATMLEHQSRLGAAGVAPQIYERNDTGDTYVEELCDATRLKTRQWWKKELFEKVGAAARTIQRACPGVVQQNGDRIRELSECLAALPVSDPEASSHQWLRNQVESACDAVDPGKESELFLSHGDLARRNVLVRRDGSIVCIDWHTVDYRSRDYDIYNYCFSIAQDDVAKPLSEHTLFEYLHEVLGWPDASKAKEDFRRFRMEFFLTRLKYFLLPGAADGARAARVLRQLEGYVESFACYEDYCDTCSGPA